RHLPARSGRQDRYRGGAAQGSQRLVRLLGARRRSQDRRGRADRQRRPRRRGRGPGCARGAAGLLPPPRADDPGARHRHLALMRHYLRHLDHLMLATALAISVFGLWIIENATKHDVPGQPTYYFDRQVAYVAVGVVGMLLLAAVPPRVMRAIHWYLYAGLLVTTIMVLVAGNSVQGGQRWIAVGPFQFQPSELGKLVLIIGLSAILAERRSSASPGMLTLIALAYVALPAVLVFMEPDFGTALVYGAITVGILFVHGAPWRHFVWLGLAGVVSIALIFSVLPGAGCRCCSPISWTGSRRSCTPIRLTRRATGTT